MKIAFSAIAILATMSLGALAKPVSVPTSPKCKNGSSNAIVIKKDLRSDFFQDGYYNKSTVYVPAAKDLYLDYVDFSEPCGVAYCNTEYKGMGRRDLTQIMNPKGSDCIVPLQTISTFVCQGGQGKVQLSIDQDGKAQFNAFQAKAYFGSSSYKKGDYTCHKATRTGESIVKDDKDFLIVDCSGKFTEGCVDTPETRG